MSELYGTVAVHKWCVRLFFLFNVLYKSSANCIWILVCFLGFAWIYLGGWVCEWVGVGVGVDAILINISFEIILLIHIRSWCMYPCKSLSNFCLLASLINIICNFCRSPYCLSQHTLSRIFCFYVLLNNYNLWFYAVLCFFYIAFCLVASNTLSRNTCYRVQHAKSQCVFCA